MKYRAFMCGGLLAATGFAQSQTYLTLEQAVVLARTHSPALRAAQQSVEASHAAVESVGLRESPLLNFDVEGVGAIWISIGMRNIVLPFLNSFSLAISGIRLGLRRCRRLGATMRLF